MLMGEKKTGRNRDLRREKFEKKLLQRNGSDN